MEEEGEADYCFECSEEGEVVVVGCFFGCFEGVEEEVRGY